MKENFEILKNNEHIVLIAHKNNPRLVAEVSKPSNEVTYLKIFSNWYLTSEVNKIIMSMQEFIKHDHSH